MKKTILLLLTITCNLMADENPSHCVSNEHSSLCMVDENSSLRIGGCYTYAWVKPKGNPTFKGSLGGAQAIYEYRPLNRIYGGVKFSWRQGSTSQNSETRFLLNFDAHERIGYTWGCSDCSWNATLFTGLGYHYMGQKLKQPGSSDLSFNYNEIYVPVGFLLNRSITSRFSLGLNATWMPQVYPAVTIKPLGGANWIIKRTVGNFIVEIPFVYRSFWRALTVELKPFFEYWQDGKTVAVSESGFALNVPKNTYLFAGTELNIGWSF